MKRAACGGVWTVLLLCGAAASAGEPWPQWRGPNGDGQVVDAAPPLAFDRQHLLWQVELPGRGQSSPVVWDDEIFLTTALERGRERVVFALDRASGKLLWQQTAWTGEPEPSHQMNGWASATCATDGERVYAFFGKGGGLFCYTKDGALVWKQPLGDFPGPWGTAACPVLVGDLVVQNCDAEGGAQIIAFDKLTGDKVWATPRENHRGWSTPLVFRRGGKTQLILNGHTGVRSYDPASGRELWFCAGFNGRGEPTATPDVDGRILMVNGLTGDVYAVQPDGQGDVSSTKRLWHTPRKSGRDLPSPAAVGHHMLVMAMKGVLTCYDTQTGQQLWEERIGGNYSASPVVADGKAVFVSEAGEVVIIDPAAATHVVAQQSFGAAQDELFRSSLAAHNGQWLLRSDRKLYCFGAK